MLMLVVTVVAVTMLTLPFQGAAQAIKKQAHYYQLIDLGTFGGPVSWFCNDLNGAGGACAILNNRGSVVSGADTSQPNPNSKPDVTL
jgi:hypothetical protein